MPKWECGSASGLGVSLPIEYVIHSGEDQGGGRVSRSRDGGRNHSPEVVLQLRSAHIALAQYLFVVGGIEDHLLLLIAFF